MRADDSVATLKGVGPALAEKLAILGIERVADLLLHRPLRYEDRTRVTPLAALRPGMRALVVARVEAAEIRQTRRRSLLVSVTDGEARLRLRYFHFSQAQVQRLATGVWLQLFGEVRAGPHGLEMVHPESKVVPDRNAGMQAVADTLTPVYPTTSGVSQARLRELVARALTGLGDDDFLPELLPEEIREDRDMPALSEALRTIHRPSADADLSTLVDGRHPAVRRLAFEEFLAQQISLRERRRRIRTHRAPRLAGDGALLRRFLDALGFMPTSAQQRVIGEILADLAGERPMLRLVQGDVGSGKTVVAAAGAVAAAEVGWQTAFMAPTELLAEQHAASLSTWLEPLGVPVHLLTGSRPASERAAIHEATANGEPAVVVGTHALFQGEARLPRLGLTVVDEQHRFGVHQRLALRDAGGDGDRFPHQLIMTATPIPRTLAMSAYADLDTSVIDELPPGRTPVSTVTVPDSRRREEIDRVAAACGAGRQAYWVCTLIEETDATAARAAEAAAQELAEQLPPLRVGLAHGRMKAADKETAMRAFKAGEIDLLVATTVIEVGVDVPNASLMVIENAERLGLAQLHQLRGRVGRGEVASHCVLLYQPPLGEVARQRLAALRATTDGFEIARRDLELRGPGEVLGTRQTGMPAFRVADMIRDADLAPAAQAAADRMLTRHPSAAQALVHRWLSENVRYALV